MPPRAILVLLAVLPIVGAQAQTPVRYINPAGLSKPTGYTHVVVAGDGRTVYIAGQVAFDSAGQLVGSGDFKAQAEQVFTDLRVALASVGGSFSDVVKTTTLITDIKQVPVLREIRARYFNQEHPPANTIIPTASLARGDLLIEIEAVAVLPAPMQLPTR
jgi:2-iminobutanoate/2-iminopropanoate deaminase